MMFTKFFTLAPLLALAVKAVTVTSPTEGQNWGTSGAQTVSWEAVSTDPTSFSVVLVNDVSRRASREHLLAFALDKRNLNAQYYCLVNSRQNRLNAADGQITLIANQSTSAGSVSVSPPSGSWTAGQAYRIRLVQNDAILVSVHFFPPRLRSRP